MSLLTNPSSMSTVVVKSDIPLPSEEKLDVTLVKFYNHPGQPLHCEASKLESMTSERRSVTTAVDSKATDVLVRVSLLSGSQVISRVDRQFSLGRFTQVKVIGVDSPSKLNIVRDHSFNPEHQTAEAFS